MQRGTETIFNTGYIYTYIEFRISTMHCGWYMNMSYLNERVELVKLNIFPRQTEILSKRANNDRILVNIQCSGPCSFQKSTNINMCDRWCKRDWTWTLTLKNMQHYIAFHCIDKTIFSHSELLTCRRKTLFLLHIERRRKKKTTKFHSKSLRWKIWSSTNTINRFICRVLTKYRKSNDETENEMNASEKERK